MSIVKIGERLALAPVSSRKCGAKLHWKTAWTVFLVCATSIIVPAQTFTTVVNFNDDANGGLPIGSLVQASTGEFYGTTENYGANSDGTVYKITPGGKLTTLHSFNGSTDGAAPFAGLVQGKDGYFYGTTGAGGSTTDGTVFKISPTGVVTNLYTFCSLNNCIDGNSPSAGLVQGNDGNFYGTTSIGGALGEGTVFRISPQGELVTLHSFCSVPPCADGQTPSYGSLVQGSDGNFYGTTTFGGSKGFGTVYRISPQGVLTTLYSFCPELDCANGADPRAGLVQGSDGNFYGTTNSGGANDYGTVFKITPEGGITTLHSFVLTDGTHSTSALVQGSDGNFYGTTTEGGGHPYGTVFQITPGGTLTVLHSFEGTDGYEANGPLVQGSDGRFYGTTSEGGANGYGTVFSLSIGLFNFPALSEQADYFAENKADYSVWRPSTGTWYLVDAGGKSKTVQWGASTDIPVMGDFDGDRKSDIAVFRPSTGTWWIVESRSGATVSQLWGEEGDIPVPGDYDGDGKTDYAVFRPSTGTWWIRQSSTGEIVSQAWGERGDIPVPGDYDGDGKTDIAVFRPSTGAWWIVQSSTGTTVSRQFGASGDEPVPGDYDGDGKTDVAIWRPSTGTWWIVPSSTGTTVATAWGVKGDVPVARDYDGDGKTDIAVWRPSTGTWWILPSSSPGTRVAKVWGASTDIPINKPVGQ